MKVGGGKGKGGAFERDVCKQLSLWVSNRTRTDLFQRSASSGAMATVHARFGRKNRTQGGDICSIAEQGNALVERFSIECKHVRNLMIVQGFTAGYGNLVRFWKQCKNDANRHRKFPLLIAKQNLVPTLVITTEGGMASLGMGEIVATRSTRLCGTWPDGPELCIVLFDELLKQPCPYS